MISAAALVTVSARLSGSAFVATSRVKTSVTASPNLLRPRVFWEKSTRSACSRSLGPSAALFRRLRGLGASTCRATSLRSASLGPRARQVPPVRELSPGDLVELPRVPHVEIASQLLEELCFFFSRASTRLCSFFTTPHKTTESFW